MRHHEYAGDLQRAVHQLKSEATTQLLMLTAAKQSPTASTWRRGAEKVER